MPKLGVQGTSLTLDGRPWWPIGINAYQLGTNWDVNAGCGAQVDLDRYFGGLAPHSLTRVNVYSSFAVNKQTGALDFSALDAVFDSARRHDQLLIAVLTGGGGGCENDHFKDHSWYDGGWKTEVSHGLPMSYQDWADTAVGRWGNSPALGGWTPVGEPEPSVCTDEACTWQARVCPTGSALLLRKFFDEVGARIRGLDPDAVIFSGHAGGAQCGSKGDDYQTVAASPGIDVLEYHFYPSTDAMPGDVSDGIARRINQAQALNKPLIVAEVGVEAGSCKSLQQREQEISMIVAEQRANGAAGVLFWSFVPDPRLNQCTLDIGPNDPLFRMIGAGAA
ncbi:beta-mannosidase [Mycolicibacterium mengxianglii]|uniref:beta-mannosidase n=1 Tax=Mycolicibacterium mengxianglii TaxID=2736649 RepID=UPI001E4D70AA|nr:beta-mannosidase [Mycolicibacterium mengxianglii]